MKGPAAADMDRVRLPHAEGAGLLTEGMMILRRRPLVFVALLPLTGSAAGVRLRPPTTRRLPCCEAGQPQGYERVPS
jgi:hypothetical protein